MPLDPTLLRIPGRTDEELRGILQMVLWRLGALSEFTAPRLDALLRETAEALELKLRQLLQPLFIVLSGREAWTPLFDSLEILGPDIARMRLRRAIAALGGLSGKQLQALEEEYARRFGPRE